MLKIVVAGTTALFLTASSIANAQSTQTSSTATASPERLNAADRRGRASVHIVHGEGDIRLATFALGAVVGELALLDRGPRSATVTVDEDLAGFALSAAAFYGLCQQQPEIAIKLLAALGHELSVRIRYANLTIQQLET